jgi:hypothetical protein
LAFVGFRWRSLTFVGVRWRSLASLAFVGVRWRSLYFGLICLDARPFTNNRPVGPLTEEIVPPDYLSLHRDIITMRHHLFAHGDASVMTRPDDYPNELVFVNDSKGTSFHMTRFFAEPPFFELITPLSETLIEKTHYHADKLGKRFNRFFGPSKNLGEFRLNVLVSGRTDFLQADRRRKGYPGSNNPAAQSFTLKWPA